GARVVAHYGKHPERARALSDELGSHCVVFGADVTQEAEVERLFAETEKKLGPVEVLVANAGYWPPSDCPIDKMTLAQWNQTIAVDLTSVFLCCREFFRGIVKHRIAEPAAILIGSTAGIFGEAGHVDYSAAKAGLTFGLARTLKNELCRIAPKGRINV